MTNLVSVLAVGFFAFATGFFVVLSYIEKPVWSLMFNTEASTVEDDNARLIHAELKRIIKLAPPTMMTVMGSGTLLTIIQAWQRNFDWGSLTVLSYLILCLSYLIINLGSRIKAVEDISSDGGHINDVRKGLGRLAALHHMGLTTALGLTLLQLFLGIGF